MIPIRLELYNFTSYGTNVPPLDFTSFQIAAISGPNGSGKSSFLDAITWVLWGSSRAGDSADPLVRKGATTMRVSFTFELSGAFYTVKRTRNTHGNGSTTLELFSGKNNLTEGTIKATQAKIVNILRLTYEVFSNSSYIRQGKADEFTLKGPNERKRILAEILGLDHYDRLEETARTHTKEISAKIQALDFAMLEIDADIALKEEREREASEAKKNVEELSSQTKELTFKLRTLGQLKESILNQVRILDEALARLSTTRDEITTLTKQIAQKRQIISECQTILNEKEAIEKANAELTKLKQDQEKFTVFQAKLIQIKDEALVLAKQVEQKEKDRLKKIGELNAQISAIATQLTESLNLKSALAGKKDHCPTCGQEIDKEKHESLEQDLKKQIETLNQKKGMLEENLARVKTFQLSIAKDLAGKEAEIVIFEKELPRWGNLVQQISALMPYEAKRFKLFQASATVDAESKSLQETAALLVKQQELAAKDITLVESLQELRPKLEKVEQEQTALEQSLKNAQEKEQQARHALGAAEQLKNRSAQMEELKQKKITEKQALGQEKIIYEELALGFGKRGVQAMLIDAAIPEIEAEANTLLDKLTDGRLRINLLTQREAKTGSTIETLDIIISDELGSRSYEMFSGGEGFRVNLALRLALSKLLTHRAGAKLQFLVIDEGFGTQDSLGQQRLVEAINAIRDNFAKIVIITHIEELKEMFPVRIEVQKGTGGSTFVLA